MIASKKTIGKLGMYIIPSKEKSLGYDINPAYVVERPAKKKLTKLQKKRKAQKVAHASHMYNLLHR